MILSGHTIFRSAMLLWIGALCCLCLPAWTQVPSEVNLIPNAGFEDYHQIPRGWYYSGDDFSRAVKHWSSATAASPDYYHPGVQIPQSWADKGFGQATPRSGEALVGITTYGCEGGKPHCREYIQVLLKEPLVYGQLYEFSFWVKKLPRSGACDNLGVAFSYKRMEEKTTSLLPLKPAWSCPVTIGAWVDRWQRVVDTIRGTGEQQYIILGNFHSDAETTFLPARKESTGYCYYYLDDVALVKLPPFLNAPVRVMDLSTLEPKPGMVVRLQSVHFHWDETTMLPGSSVDLDKLLELMRRYPDMVVAIVGHTDNEGGDEYNLALSERRALAVADYLYDRGIDHSRLRWKGMGERQPAASNDTPEGRQINRRVEFHILSVDRQ
jgi:OOP family OmpA-OmpF porin